ALVNAKKLFEIAKKLGFEEFLLLSKGEQKSDSKGRMYILANAFEAFIGALYLDQGLEMAKKFVYSVLIGELKEIIEKKLYQNPKSRLQELVQEKFKITPTYKVLKEWGPDHAKNFVVGVFFEDELVATGEGSSKQEAEEDAAQRALKVKNLE
ncbi:ribonuclease III, partial [Candidatus Parcubacteria bacterium]|nr:ribonuclease III [Candidatus Parcubacteria bacterium]